MKTLIIVCVALSVIGCAHHPIVDTQGVDPAKYANDLRICRWYADHVSTAGNAAAGAGIGAGLGAVTGLLVGAFFGVDAKELAGFGAAIGGLHGATAGAADAERTKYSIIRKCLIGRGYKVLD